MSMNLIGEQLTTTIPSEAMEKISILDPCFFKTKLLIKQAVRLKGSTATIKDCVENALLQKSDAFAFKYKHGYYPH